MKGNSNMSRTMSTREVAAVVNDGRGVQEELQQQLQESFETALALNTDPTDDCGINPLDDTTNVKQWMDKNMTDAKSLAKRFPHTTHDLESGKVSPEAVASHILKLSEIVFVEDMDQNWEVIATTLTKLVLPPQCTNKNDSVAFVSQMLKNMHRNIYDNWGRQDLAVKEALNETCRGWAKRFDRMMRAKKGTFLSTCLLYNMTQQRFNGEIFPKVAFHGMFTKKQLVNVATSIAEGHLNVKYACWECGIQSSRQKQSTCTGCRVARYCSRYVYRVHARLSFYRLSVICSLSFTSYLSLCGKK